MNDEYSPKHLITELGVLKNISIGKRLSSEKIKEYKDKLKKSTKTKEDTNILLEKILKKSDQQAIDFNSVPGMIHNEISKDRQATEKKLIELTYLASIINKKTTEKKMNKFDKCYLINVLVNMMGLDEQDFDRFHEIFNKFKSGEIDSPESGSDEPLSI